MRIKLILAAGDVDPLATNNQFKPLALSILAGLAPEHDYEMVDMLKRGTKINFNKPADLVGISVRASSERRAFMIADKFREKNIPVVLGGPQVSLKPFESLKHADAVVVGEAECLWNVLLEDLQKNSLKKLYVCTPKEFDAKGLPAYVLRKLPSLEAMKKPLRKKVFHDKYRFDMVYASRGCPVQCEFCVVSDLFGKKTRMRPVDEVINEIRELNRHFYLIDDNVFGRPDTYDYYLELYQKISAIDKKYFWAGQANLSAVSSEKGREVIKKSANSGLVYVAVGLESLNQKVLEKSGSAKKLGFDNDKDIISKMKERIAFLQDYGLVVSGWFVIGYEDDTIESYYKALEFCKEAHIIPHIVPVTALPDSRLYKRLEKEGRLQDGEKNVSNIYHPSMSNKQILKALSDIKKDGFSYKQRIKRLSYWISRFHDESIHHRIHRTVFSFFTQQKLARLASFEYKYFKSKVKD